MEGDKKIAILVVEDSATQAERLAYVLERHGYAVTTAKNGKEALEMIDKTAPTLIVSDVIMPEMDGFEFCKELKTDTRFKDIPLILLTALSEPQDVLKGLECGADNFVTKPYDEAYLLTRIHHVLMNSQLRRESQMDTGVEIFFKGRKYCIASEGQQILDLLLSTYETAVMKNRELKELQEELKAMNELLEKRVEERTAALTAEIEERRKAEAEIGRLNVELEKRVIQRTAQLEEANRDMESFSYSVSHDLKAPLRAIDGFSNRLWKIYGDKLDGEFARLIGIVRENATKMSRLIDDILAFSRVGRSQVVMARLDMKSLVGSIIEEYAAAAQSRTVRFEIGELPPAMGDEAAVRQVFMNLLANAIKFTKSRDVAVIEMSGEEKGADVVYHVKDNGVGFDDRFTDQLFGIFQRLHGADEFEGTGIGLAIVKRFINKLGGRVWAKGRINEGATFYFTLHRAPEIPETRPVPPR